MPLNRIFHKSSLPVLLGIAAIAFFVLYSSAGHSRAKPPAAAQPAVPTGAGGRGETAVNVSVVAIYKALGGVGQPLSDAAPTKVAQIP